MKILVTGGAGYIGSHTCTLLAERGHDVIIADNFCNSTPDIIDKIELLSKKKLKVYECDLCDLPSVEHIFKQESITQSPIECIIHFAALKAVGESIEKPLTYYYNNLSSTINILSSVQKYGVENFIFSSSATVYSTPQLPDLLASNPNGITEDFPTGTINPYGTTKLLIEKMLSDCHLANPSLNIGILRYFNPIGAHPSSLLGENPCGIPNNLVPCIAKVAIGEIPNLNVFGNDYPTPDGTCIRDYIHVMDLAEAHLAVLEKMPSFSVYNIGTGKGYSVLEIIKEFEKVSGRHIPYSFCPRRSGDIAECWANPTKANIELNWKSSYDLTAMCLHSWNFICKQKKIF